MKELIMDTLDISNFRGFKHLQIERLSRVNLISGKNNVGKSSLLEALQLYAYDGTPSLIWRMLRTRDEGQSYRRLSENVSLESMLLDLRYLFYGRREIVPFHEPITIGPINSPDESLTISMGWYVRSVSEDDDPPRYQLLRPDEFDSADNPVPRFTIQTGKTSKSYPIRTRVGFLPTELRRKHIMITPDGLDRVMIGALWDNIALTSLEKDVVEALCIIAPGVERVSVVGSLVAGDQLLKDSDSSERRTIPIVGMAELDERISLRSLGDGMQRTFGLALALVNAANGMVLVDEIENGLHYSVQLNIWRIVFQLARRLNIQVFATTHSLDCINAFRRAAKENEGEGLYFRLQARKDEIKAITYEEEELTTAIQNDQEVR